MSAVRIPVEELEFLRAAKADSNIGLGEAQLLDHIDVIEAEHAAAMRAVSIEWSAERERVKADRQALRELVKELAAELEEAPTFDWERCPKARDYSKLLKRAEEALR